LRRVANGADGARAALRPAAAIELNSALRAYGSLLTRLQWNGKPRAGEAEVALAEAEALLGGDFAEIFACAAARGDESGNRVAGGALEPWYAPTMGADFLKLVHEQSE